MKWPLSYSLDSSLVRKEEIFLEPPLKGNLSIDLYSEMSGRCSYNLFQAFFYELVRTAVF